MIPYLLFRPRCTTGRETSARVAPLNVLSATIWRHLASDAPTAIHPLAAALAFVSNNRIAELAHSVRIRCERAVRAATAPVEPDNAIPASVRGYLANYATNVTPQVVAVGVLAFQSLEKRT